MLICAYFESWQLVYALKSVGNLGLAAPVFVPLLEHFMLSQSWLLELRLAAIYALRRYPCSVDVSPNRPGSLRITEASVTLISKGKR